MTPKKPKFAANVCGGCMQTTNYAMGLDKGTAHIVLAIFYAIGRIGKNSVHLLDEAVPKPEGVAEYREMIKNGHLTHRMVANASRARFHGLIAFIDKGSGLYLLTKKGQDFLWGAPVPRVAVIDKKSDTLEGYFNESDTITIGELLKEKTGPYWEGELEVQRRRAEAKAGLFDNVGTPDILEV